MNKRPRSVTVLSWTFIVIGSIVLLTSLLPKAPEPEQLRELRANHPLQNAFILAGLAGPVLAAICGVLMLIVRPQNTPGKFSRPVWKIMIGAAVFALSFFSAYLAQSGGIKVSFLSPQRQVIFTFSVLLAEAALVWVLVSVVWWIAFEIRARHRATRVPTA